MLRSNTPLYQIGSRIPTRINSTSGSTCRLLFQSARMIHLEHRSLRQESHILSLFSRSENPLMHRKHIRFNTKIPLPVQTRLSANFLLKKLRYHHLLKGYSYHFICLKMQICFSYTTQVIHPSPEPAGMTSFLAVSLPPDSCPDKTGEFLSVPIASRKVRLETDWKITGIVRKHPTGIRRQRTSQKRLGNGWKRWKPAGSNTEIAETGRPF